MVLKFILSLFMLTFVVGCATTQKPSAVNELQIKVAQMENKLDDKEQEITALREEVTALSSQIETLESAPVPSEPAEDVSSVSSASSKSSDNDIIRVEASPKDLQRALKAAGYYTGSIDGKIGSKTKSAVQQFQKDHNLNADGVVGKKTWSELKTYLN